MSSAPIGENSVMSAIVITPPCCSTLPTGAFAPNVTRLGRWRYFREYFKSETGFPRSPISGSPLAEKVEKAKIVHLAHVLQFAWLHNIGVEPQPAGESGRERRTEDMSAEENKALARRSWEIVGKGSLDTLEEALKEVYADTIVMHEPDEDVRGIEGMTQFV